VKERMICISQTSARDLAAGTALMATRLGGHKTPVPVKEAPARLTLELTAFQDLPHRLPTAKIRISIGLETAWLGGSQELLVCQALGGNGCYCA
jgi:hypothetical protein